MINAFTSVETFRNNNKVKVFAINKLHGYNILYINNVPIDDCSNSEIEQEYSLVLKSDPIIDYLESEIDKHEIKTANIYLIGNLKYNFVKIGFSTDVKKRLSGIQNGCPFDLSILKIIKGTKRLEKRLHIKYQKYNVRGEWFRIEGNLKEDMLKDSILKY